MRSILGQTTKALDLPRVHASVTRPSEGQQTYAASPALQQLLAAAESAGVAKPIAGAATRAVLATFLERMPQSARDHLLAHLPRDVQVLATPPRRRGAVHRIRRFDDLIDAALSADHVSQTNADVVATAVLHALRELVPEEGAHIAAVLPADLRRLWVEPIGT